MNSSAGATCCGIDRRGFLIGAGLGLIGGSSLVTGAALIWNRFQEPSVGSDETQRFSGRSAEVSNPDYAMPGRFPGRVVEVQHYAAVNKDHLVDPGAVKTMISRGMRELTGAEHPGEAWASFFQRGDVVGIKVNPVGYKRRSGVVGCISNPHIILQVVENLKQAGVRPQDIIVFERYANEFREAGYEKLMLERAMDNVRWYASGSGYDPGQLDIEGYDSRVQKRDRDPHVVGYDPDVFVHMGFADPGFANDERCYRSHLSLIVTQMVNKIISIPVLKDHRSAGVTLALKNLSHGLNNNVARSHIANVQLMGELQSDPNQCNTFIPTAVSQPLVRQKAVLHILDGLIGAYEGGPGSWNSTWGTWKRQSLFFATDPVALDHVGWDIIDAERARQGWQPVARMGKLQTTPRAALSSRLASLAARAPTDSGTLAILSQGNRANQETEQFDRRQPEHIILAGTIGLGIFDASRIEHKQIRCTA
jgi:uncharacterized protein (DUF362 family)